MPRGLQDRRLRDLLNFSRAEWQQAKRSGIDPREIKTALQQCWATSDNRTSFKHVLKEHGFWLAKGDRRGFVAVDYRGEVYSLSRYGGVTAGSPGDMVYNTSFRSFQGCTPHGWYAFHNIPQETKLTAADAAAYDQFGGSVSVSEDIAVFGALGDNDGCSASGSAYVFRDTGGGTWVQEAKLTASDAAASDDVGNSVLGNIAVIGTCRSRVE